MPDLVPELTPRLMSYRIPGVELAGDFVFPNYAGYSLLNLPDSICQALGVAGLGSGPLGPELAPVFESNVRHVVLLVMDALGLDLFQRFALRESTIWKKVMPEATLAPLTSVAPSTTTAVLTTLWTGRGPGAHGIVGYELWLKEFGVVANMIIHSVMTASGDVGGLARSGFDARAFLPVPVLGPHLSQQEILSYAFMPAAISQSGLSAMHLIGTEVYPYRSMGDLWISLADLLEARREERNFIYAYWPEVDTLSHRFSPEDGRLPVEFAAFSKIFEQQLIQRIASANRGDTLVILTADHGQLFTPHNPAYELRHHPELVDMLHMLPTGENRLTYLYVKPGRTEDVQDYFARAWPGQFSILPSLQALEAGLFGPGPASPQAVDRIGDLVAIAHGDAYLWWSSKENHMLGRHGGLAPREMLVPFFAFRV